MEGHAGETATDKGKGTKDLKLFYLTWPIFLEISLFMMMGIADTFMLSAISDNAVSGVGAANQFLHISILLLEVIGNGASIVVAQYIGSRKFFEASKISAVAVTLNLLVGIVMSVLFVVFNGYLLRSLNLQGEVYEFAHSYLAIVGGAIFLQAIINSLAAIIRVHGFTKEAMFVSLGMNVIHIIGNYALIFGNFGMPALGVEGAAISTVASRLLAIVVFFWLLYRIMAVRIQFSYYFNLSKEYIGKILKIGIPSALEQVMYQSCQIIFIFYTTFLGEAALAAKQYATNISMFIYLFALAVGMGTSIMVGRLVGEARPNDAYKRVWMSVRSAIIGTLIVVALVMLFREQLVGMFTEDADVLRIGAQVLLYSLLLETGRTINLVIVNALRASGDAKYPLFVGMFSMVGMSLSLGYLFVFHFNMGLAGIWLAIAADEWLRAIIFYFRWKSRAWEKHALVRPDKEPDHAAVHV
ncbi:MATE family efflux transporter [Paenibacillus sp. 1011MAR3C5]|uniref:MATE family efflux transporter n=1 Tax=Paenibacillus sp. 1011MAR3C5 TaxID=1675787 RepID=UPI000E6C4DAB|nr:MATE family efflux transporter [Paenibacillus sp. 1011MAR3C5]RJE86098.1 MATE family efflux transporter [Paenibacillus sp. 1011MAR3C5]